jgi:hypothetical protein
MKRAGSSSWTFGHGIEQLPHAALYVRDVTGLQPPPGQLLPPRLAVPDGERLDVLDETGRAEAGAQWLRWWRALVLSEAAQRPDSSGGLQHGLWPDDEGWIADLGNGQAALQQAVAAGFAEGCRWFGRHRSPEPDTDRACFEWSLVRDVAEDVARRHHVSPGAVRGYAVVLRLDGTWWAGFGSGAAVCSVAAAQDPQTARDVLLEAFESGLTGQR